MSSKRFKKLPENTNKKESDTINNLIPIVKKIVQLNLMSLLI